MSIMGSSFFILLMKTFLLHLPYSQDIEMDQNLRQNCHHRLPRQQNLNLPRLPLLYQIHRLPPQDLLQSTPTSTPNIIIIHVALSSLLLLPKDVTIGSIPSRISHQCPHVGLSYGSSEGEGRSEECSLGLEGPTSKCCDIKSQQRLLRIGYYKKSDCGREEHQHEASRRRPR